MGCRYDNINKANWDCNLGKLISTSNEFKENESKISVEVHKGEIFLVAEIDCVKYKIDFNYKFVNKLLTFFLLMAFIFYFALIIILFKHLLF